MNSNRAGLGKRHGMIFVLTLVAGSFLASDVSAEIPWKRDPGAVMQSAQQSGKPILVFVTAKWCHYCQKMKRDTWSDPKVSAPVSKAFETLVLDGDQDKAIVSQMGLHSYPATLVYSSGGELLGQKRGYMTASKTMNWLRSTLR